MLFLLSVFLDVIIILRSQGVKEVLFLNTNDHELDANDSLISIKMNIERNGRNESYFSIIRVFRCKVKKQAKPLLMD